MKALRDDSGQALIFVALSLTGILGFVGLATDVGALLHTKRNLQIVADSAAVAGASELNYSTKYSDISAAAQNAATQNGVTNGSNGATVTVNNPVTDGYHQGAGYVEVIVSQQRPVIFLGLFGWGSMTVNTRAVATNGAPGTACVYALNSNLPDTIHLQGSFDVSVPGCEVIDDSSDPNALYFTGAGGVLSAGAVGVVGGAGGQTGDSTPAPVTGIVPVSDPLAGTLSPPNYTPSSCSAPPSGATWGVGLPADGSGVVCYSGTIKVQNTVNMNPGTYVFTGTLDFSGGGTLNGNGVTLYIAPGGTLGGNGNGNTTLNLTAPQLVATKTSPATCSSPCPYNGVLIYQDSTNSNTIKLNGTPVANFTGIVYAPTAQFELSGNTTMTLTTDFVVGQLYDKGNASITLYDYSRVIGGPLKSVALVE
jgi:Flp pilus assembly protein TadG